MIGIRIKDNARIFEIIPDLPKADKVKEQDLPEQQAWVKRDPPDVEDSLPLPAGSPSLLLSWDPSALATVDCNG